MHIRGSPEKFVAEVSEGDIKELESWGEVPGARQLWYLQRNPVKA